MIVSPGLLSFHLQQRGVGGDGVDLVVQALLSVHQADLTDVGLSDVAVVRAEEVQLVTVLEARLQHTVARDLALVGGAELPHLRGHTVFFQEGVLGEVKHQRIVCGVHLKSNNVGEDWLVKNIVNENYEQ